MVLPQKTPDIGYLNPTVVVQAYFLVPVEGDIARRTQFKLCESHDIARWLLTFIEYFLSQQGLMEAGRRIADPPGGETCDELVRGKVILVGQRPDGGQLLRLNPNLEMGLYLYARRHGEPALDVGIALGENPELSVWLLAYCLAGGKIPPQVPLTGTLIEALRRYSIFVDELPAESVYLPDPKAPGNLAEELAPMARIFYQAAGEPIPAEVRDVLGDFTPVLPPGVDLLWGQDAGTGMVFPILRAGPGADNPEPLVGTRAKERAAQWERQLAEAKNTTQEYSYAVLREILPPAQREKYRHYVRQLRDHGYFPGIGVGDAQVALRTNIHKEPTIAALHKGLARLINRFDDPTLIGSFCQLGIYEGGAVLEKHIDRSQCVRNISFLFDMWSPQGEPEPWPFHLEIRGETRTVLLKPGDGAVYPGTKLVHWRDALPENQRAIAAFFFFVPPDFQGTMN